MPSTHTVLASIASTSFKNIMNECINLITPPIDQNNVHIKHLNNNLILNNQLVFKFLVNVKKILVLFYNFLKANFY